MDSTAASLCKDNDIPIIVFGLDNPEKYSKGSLRRKYWNNNK